jgi:magnesium-dependent phosphatase 1
LIPGSLRDDGADPKKVRSNGVLRAMDIFDYTEEIYPGSKITHFKELHKKTGAAYEDMVSHAC